MAQVTVWRCHRAWVTAGAAPASVPVVLVGRIVPWHVVPVPSIELDVYCPSALCHRPLKTHVDCAIVPCRV